MNTSVTQPLVLRQKSRSSRFASWTGDGNHFYDKLLRILYIFMLVAIDFVMFIYSINGKIIEDGEPNQAIMMILGGVGIVSFALIILLSFSRDLQNIVCAFITMVITAVFFYQFALFDVDNFIETWLNKHASWLTFICIIPSAWLVGLFLGIIVFFLFRYTFTLTFVTLVLAFAGLTGVKNSEFIEENPKQYSEVKRMTELGDGRLDNLVYFMIPKFPSYQFLNSVRDRNFRELRDIMVGFYSVNDFEIYPNAFVKDPDTLSNVIDIFNQVDYTSTTSQNRGYSEFINNWELVKGTLDYWALDENRLYEHLHKNQYRTSTYSMPGLNLCLTGNQENTDRCVMKNYKFVSLYDKNKTVEANIYSLLSEWLLSLKLRDFNSIAKMFAKMSAIKGDKVTAENRRQSIIGAPDLITELNNQFSKDKHGKAYMVYVDLPSDIYIYDEFCRLKPKEDWVALKDNSLTSVGIDEKRKAYSDQAKCLVGLLQMYVDEMNESNKSYQTDVIVQGVSTIRELAGMTAGRYGNFVKDNLVSLAIRKSKKPRFLINANICLASDFTKTLIRYQDYCYTLDNMNIPSEEMLSLKKNLINNSIIRGNRISTIAANYKYWYEEFKKYNPQYLEKLEIENQLQLQKEKIERVKREQLRREKEAESKANVFLPSEDLIMEMDDDGRMAEFDADSFEANVDVLVAEVQGVLKDVEKNSESVDSPEVKAIALKTVNVPEVKNVVPETLNFPEVKNVAPEIVNFPEAENVAPEIVNSPEAENVAPEIVNSPEVKNVAPEIVNSPEVKNVAPEIVNSPEAENVAPEIVNSPEVENVAPEIVNSPEVKNVAPETVNSPEVKNVAPETVNSPEVENVAPETVNSPEVKNVTPETVNFPEVKSDTFEMPNVVDTEIRNVEY